MRARGPSKERQEQIAREMGLLPPLEPRKTAFELEQDRIRDEAEARIAEMRRTHLSYPEEPDPCTGCKNGRHKIEGKGWCIDGVFYAYGDINAIKKNIAVHGKKFENMLPALRKLHAAIPLDFGSIEVKELDDVR